MYTSYFPRCGHATSHLDHRDSQSGPICNKSCLYNYIRDYWYLAPQGELCSYCRFTSATGFGTHLQVPSRTNDLRSEFSMLFARGTIEESDERYAARLKSASVQYTFGMNVRLENLQRTALVPLASIVAPAAERAIRMRRFEDRWLIRRIRARQRTDNWVMDVRNQQYRAVREGLALGERPYIHSTTPNRPQADLLTEIKPLSSLPEPTDICPFCRGPLNEIEDAGTPHRLPCNHAFHFICAIEMFSGRSEANFTTVHDALCVRLGIRISETS